MAVSGGVYPMDHAMGYSGESLFAIQFAWFKVSRSGGIPHIYNSQLECTSPIMSGQCSQVRKLVNLVNLENLAKFCQACGGAKVSPVLATHEAIQS